MLFNTDAADFKRFRQISMVFHDLDVADNYRTYAHCMKKLLRNFIIVHTYGDNRHGETKVTLPLKAEKDSTVPTADRMYSIPSTLSVTLVRKDFARQEKCSSSSSSPLDI